MKHYTYGGSSAARTLACPGWIDQPYPDQPPSEFAERGTALHEAIEWVLEGGADGDDVATALLGMTFNNITLDADDALKVVWALEAWDDFCKQYGVIDYDVEVTLEIDEDTGGTCDVIAWDANGNMYLIDFKFGDGIEVEATGNKQLLFYAMCAQDGKVVSEAETGSWTKQIVKQFKAFAIIQPILSREQHLTLDVWEPPGTVVDLFKQSYNTVKNQSHLKAGEHCLFCPASPYCAERSGEARAALMANPVEAKMLADNLDTALKLEDWIRDVKREAHAQMELGTELTGFKLVAKRATRKWNDVMGAMKALARMKGVKKDDYLKTDLLSPAQIEKLKGVDMDKLDAYITKQSSGTTLAREDDKREAIHVNANALSEALNRI